MACNLTDDGNSCIICMETFKKPKLLSCGHTFCELCIHLHILKKTESGILADKVECPICRKYTEFESKSPETWAKSLPLNFALDSMLSTYSDSHDDHVSQGTSADRDSKFACQPCLDDKNLVAAIWFCVECNEYMCKKCFKLHDRFNYMKGHEVLSIEGQEKKLQFLTCIKPMQRCRKHQEKIQYLCSDHNKLCCCSCIIQTHKDCKTLHIEKISETKPIREQIKELKDMNRKVKSAWKFWTARQNERDRQIHDLRKVIQTKRTEVNNMFDNLDRETIIFAKRAHNESTITSKKRLECCEKINSAIDNVVYECESAIEYGTTVQQYIMTQDSQLKEKMIQNREKVLTEVDNLVSTEVHLSFDTFKISTDEQRGCIGEPYVKTCKLDVENLPDPREVQFIKRASIIQETGSWYRSIDFLRDGRLVAADYNKSKLVLLNKRLGCISKYDMLIKPYTVKVLDDDIILVTSGNEKTLFRFKVDVDNLVQIDTTTLRVHCDSISQIDGSTFSVGLFGGQKPHGIIEVNGDENDAPIVFPEKQYTAENSKCMYDLKSGFIAMSDKNADKVYIADTQNHTKTVIQCEGIMQPRGLVFGRDDTVFICSGGTDSIVHVTSEGCVLKIHKLNISHPYAICASRDQTLLAVANMEIKNRQIQMFELQA